MMVLDAPSPLQETLAPRPAVAPASRRLTLCVDDFGMHEGVNTSVLILMSMGRLGATSVLVDGPAMASGAQRLLQALPKGVAAPDVGLHLNLSEPLPRADAPESREFRAIRLPSLIVRAYGRLLDRGVILREIQRQCEAFERLFGRAPDYVDGHQHVHQLPIVREALLEVLMDRYGWQRPWLRRTRPAGGDRLLKARIIGALGDRRMAALAERQGYAQNGHLLGVHDFTSDPLVYQERLAGWLADCSDGDVLMTHPSVWTSEPGLLLAQRMAEHEVLSGPGFERQLQAAGVVLGRFMRPDSPLP